MKITFTLLLSLFTLSAFAQQKFVPGHYITLQGEKIEVLINDRNWDKNPTFIEVTNTNTGNVQKLNVADIKGFALSTGDVYDAFIVDVDKSPTKPDAIKVNAQPIIDRDTVFLRAVVKGAAELYYLKDENAKEHYYLKKGDEAPVELIYRITKHVKGNTTGFTKLAIYKGMLTAKLGDCAEVAEKIDRADFKVNKLKDIVTQYNQCVGGAGNDYIASEEKIKYNVMALAGASYYTLDIDGHPRRVINDADFKAKSYTAGISLIATLPRGRGKWALQGDLLYKPYSVEAVHSEYGKASDQVYTKIYTEFDFTYLGLNTAVRYRLLDAAFAPYLSAGIASNFMLTDNSKSVSYNRYQTGETYQESKPVDSVRKYEQALLLGVGVQVKKFLCEFKLEKGNGFTTYTNLSTDRNSYSLLIGYRLK